ncbi:MAG: hypothetical protein GF370_00940 [Candidatus Nealsonbacteria bacterium]|nr:hypothetical protein [Candidatus Nealsonbacteria bacterium]
MNKQKLIKEILNDLYALDSGFKKYEAELEKIIVSLLETRPDTKFDEGFKRRLQDQLVEEIEKMERASGFSLSALFSGKNLSVFSGAFLTLLILAVPTFMFLRNYYNAPEEVFSPVFSVESLSEKAFGDLRLVQEGQTGDGEVTGRGGGGTFAEEPGVSQTEIMKRPDMVRYEYIYKGEDVVLEEEQVEVLKRVKQINSSGAFKNIINSLDFGLLEISSFPRSEVERISFSQGSGYVVNIDFVEGLIYIHKNWRDQPVRCMGEGCVNPQPLKPSDVPPDAKLIEIANRFVSQHGIDLSMYGDPEVSAQSHWLLERAETSFAPSVLRVIYPLVINGGPVFDEWGNRFGMGVSINLYDLEVESLDNLTSHKYLKSVYGAETDFSKIVSLAEKGGFRGDVFYGEGEVETVEIGLGTPSFVYMKTWNYTQKEPEELLVPSLMFPVVSAPDSFSRQGVVIPLVESLLDMDSNVRDISALLEAQ